MKKNTYRIATVAAFSVLTLVGFSKPWSPSSNPANLSASINLNYNFDSLPKSALLEGPNQPWSDTYWPSFEGGIAVPYRTGVDAWKSPLPSKADILSGVFGADQINNLSPAAKFDLLRGRYDFPLTRQVLAANDAKNPKWWGICHGWSPAALNHSEPQPTDAKNADGVAVHFGSSDVKALIDYYYGVYAYNSIPTTMIGTRCNGGILTGNCGGKNDLNAGAFHLVLANLIGLQKRGFVGDVTQGKEVWNQPIVGFDSRIVEEKTRGFGGFLGIGGPAKGTKRMVKMHTTMKYVVEVAPQEAPMVGTASQSFETKEYEYWVEIDAYGNVIGGKWESTSDGSPDFFWVAQKAQFSGEFADLNRIYVQAQQ